MEQTQPAGRHPEAQLEIAKNTITAPIFIAQHNAKGLCVGSLLRIKSIVIVRSARKERIGIRSGHNCIEKGQHGGYDDPTIGIIISRNKTSIHMPMFSKLSDIRVHRSAE